MQENKTISYFQEHKLPTKVLDALVANNAPIYKPHPTSIADILYYTSHDIKIASDKVGYDAKFHFITNDEFELTTPAIANTIELKIRNFKIQVMKDFPSAYACWDECGFCTIKNYESMSLSDMCKTLAKAWESAYNNLPITTKL